MPNDAIFLTVDNIRFHWKTFKSIRGYLISVSFDNQGNLQIVELPGSKRIIHRPKSKPFVWDFGFDGYPIYFKTGGIPDMVAFSLMIIKDRFQAREAGRILQEVTKNDEYKNLLGNIEKLITQAAAAAGSSGASIAIAAVMGIVNQATKIVGKTLKELKDKEIEKLEGSMKFSVSDQERTEIHDQVTSAICSADFGFQLFDAKTNEETEIDIRSEIEYLKNRNLLIGVNH